MTRSSPFHQQPSPLERRLGPRLEALYRLAWRLEGDPGRAEAALECRLGRPGRRRLAGEPDPALSLARFLLRDAAISLPEHEGGEGAAITVALGTPIELSALEAALAALSPGERLLLLLHHADGDTPEQLAGLFECEPETVRRLLSRGRDALRRQLPGEAPPPASSECPAARARLDGWLEGALDPAEAEGVGHHLSVCSACRHLVRGEQALRHALGRRIPPPPPPGFQGRMRDLLTPGPRLPWLRLHGTCGWRRYSLPLAGAALLLLLFILWVVAQSAGQQPSPRSSHQGPVVTEDGRIVAPGTSRERERIRAPRSNEVQ